MTGQVVLCGNGCGHNHDSPNGPTGCCDKHGPYMYFCGDCHDAWAAATDGPVSLASARPTNYPTTDPRRTDAATTNGAHDA